MQPRNPYLCLAIVGVLGIAGLVGMLGMIVLAFYGKPTPEAIVALSSGALGALSSFLVSVPRGSSGGGSHHDGQPDQSSRKDGLPQP